MKKIFKYSNYLSQLFIIIGIPTLFVYGFQIHNEQIRMKDQKIETIEAFNETLKFNQINSVMDRYKALKEHNQEIIDDFKEKSKDNDSLKKIIESLGLKFENKVVCLDREQSITIAKGLIAHDYQIKEIEILEKIIQKQEEQINYLKNHFNKISKQN